MKKRIIYLFFFLLSGLSASGQKPDSAYLLTRYIEAVENFARCLPQEKVYLHFDNTGYYQGDKIWYSCYIVTSESNHASPLSKTLYVELLNPGGEIIDRKILKIENGRCHGDFTLNRLPFYSGFYEVRAYTKYMLNFGEEIIFSRLLPVFDKPKKEGDFEEKNMQKNTTHKYPAKREKTKKGKKVNLKLFPEGGNLIEGVASRVAFEATDAFGNPIEINGTIVNETKEETGRFSTIHDGRGVFTFTPQNNEKTKVIIRYNEKNYKFDMPEALPQGYVMQVDNLSYADSIGITLQKHRNTPSGKLGLAVISKGRPYHYCLINLTRNKTLRFKIDKTELPAGVSRIVLFDTGGKILCDRLLFINRNERIDIRIRTDKADYAPYEPVEMDISVTDQDKNPVQVPLSLSVRDGMGEIESGRNMQTYLLLMSEIKGYVRTPSFYFEADDSMHRKALDLLLMVQGWRRYSWSRMAGIEPFELKYQAEEGIETKGTIVSFVKKKPKPDVDVSLLLMQKGEEEEKNSYIQTFVTDSLGRFSFVSDVCGEWDMIVSVMEKGKKKDYRILLDRLFNPTPRPYPLAEMQISVPGFEEKDTVREEKNGTPVEDPEVFLTVYKDSLPPKGIQDKIHNLGEVVVKAKKRSKEKDIFTSRSKSIAYYDAHSEMDDIKDEGKYIGDDIHELMINLNKNFSHYFIQQGDYLKYKGRMPLFVINYEPTMATEMDYNKYKLIRLEAIKSIYVSEDIGTMCKYADPRISPLEIDKIYGCVVFIETLPEGMIPAEAAKGVRKTRLRGYSQTSEFYSPDYSAFPPEPDYRRTLYWNPSVIPDTTGKTHIRFYNNSRCRKLKIEAETISPNGIIGKVTTHF